MDNNSKITLREKVIQGLKNSREKLLRGGLNCIPTPYKRFADDFIGLEQECYYAITSFTKAGKSQFTSYTLLYSPIMYCYFNRNIKFKAIYFALEETPERILHRFISWLLYSYSDGKLIIPPKDLRSTTKVLSQDIIDLIESKEIQDIIAFFEESVLFPEEGFNPTGIYKCCKEYAENNGEVKYKYLTIKDDFGNDKELQIFDSYTQEDPDEFRLIILDTINLIDTERGKSKKESMDKMSEYFAKYLRNRYKFSIAVIQQQSMEQEGLDAIKLGKIRPSVAGLGDSKYIARDANVVLGLFSPFRFGLAQYEGYNIQKFRDNIRFLEVIINRDGEMGGICPLFFNGAVCQFDELPLPNNTEELNEIYKYLNKLRNG